MSETGKGEKKSRGRKGTGWLIAPEVEGGIWHCGYKHKGKRYRWSSHSPLKTDAIASLDVEIPKIRAGTFRAASAEVTGKDIAERWLATYVPGNRNEKGRRLAKARVDRYFTPFFGRIRAGEITKDCLRRYRAHLEGLTKEGDKPDTTVPALTDQSIRHILADARCALIWAADSDLIDRAPIPERLLPDIPESEPRALTPEEQKKVCAVEDPWGFACRLMLGCGARWSELCRLDAADLVNGELIIRPTADARRTRGGGRIKGKRIRRVPISPALVAEIRQHVGKLTPYEDKDDPAFNRAVRRRSGVEDFSAHALRHSFAVNYLMAGGNIRAIQLQLGHASLATTERYIKLTQELVREDARKVIGWSAEA